MGLARRGDSEAFAVLVGPYLRELQAHCYRILGSAGDAEDALQETLRPAWRGLGGFEGQASLRTWLFRVATNRCLDVLRAGRRRPRVEPARLDIEPPEPTRYGGVWWLQPYPGVLLAGVIDQAPGPAARVEAREAVSTRVRHGPAAASAEAARGAGAAGCAGLSRRRSGGNAGRDRGVGEKRPETGARHPAGSPGRPRRRRAGPAARFRGRTAAGGAVCPRVRGRRRGRRRRPAHGRRLADDAPRAAGVSRAGPGRQLPGGRVAAARAHVPAGAHPGERPARVRVLRPWRPR